jgi:hypothetical protein
MKLRKTPVAENSTETPAGAAVTTGSRLTRVRRNQRILIQHVKQSMAARQNAVPPPCDPLAP